MLREGEVGVMPTDTLYGVVASALCEEAVLRVYALKKRSPAKPCIILIASLADLTQFGVSLNEKQREALSKYWPGPVSIVLACGKDVPEYLHRGTHTLAFRLPADEKLVAFLQKSGPLIAPSANPEGFPPASTVVEAKEYFGTAVDFYIDGGTRAGKPSTLIALAENGEAAVLR